MAYGVFGAAFRGFVVPGLGLKGFRGYSFNGIGFDRYRGAGVEGLFLRLMGFRC